MIDEELVETLTCIRDEYCSKYTAYDSWSKHCCPVVLLMKKDLVLLDLQQVFYMKNY